MTGISAVLAALAAYTLSTCAFAADTGAYLVGSVGQTKFENVNSDILGQLPFAVTDKSLDDKGSGFKVGGGYVFNRNVAIEGAYVDLGKATETGTRVPGGTKWETESEANGVVGTFVGLAPVSDELSLQGRIGFIMGYLRTTDSGGRAGQARELKLTFGIGVAYSLVQHLAIRLDFDRYQVGDATHTGEIDVDMISMGLAYKFR
jgi:OOP family OmpA-OmpF porin